MNNDYDYLFILDRINVPEKILLDRSGYTYICGRAKESDIVCRSSRVSNRHCTFFHNKNELYITDLKSTHGTFINDALQQPFQTVKLHLNDVIGIGCLSIPNLTENNDIYAYKLRAFQPISGENGESDSVPSATSSSNNKETANDMTVANNMHKRKQQQPNSDFKLLCKIPKFRDQKCMPGNNDFSKQLNIIQGKDTEKNKTRDTLNAEGRINMNMLTCSKNWPNKSARFSKSKESGKLSKPLLSCGKKTERQGQSKSEQHLHATEQKNRQVPRKWADTVPLNATLFKALSTEELETLKNEITMELKEMEGQRPASLENKHEKKNIFPKPKVNITTKSGNDIHLGQTIAGSGKNIAIEEPTASSSRFAAADNTSSNAKTNKSENVSKEMVADSYHELYNRLLILKR